MRRKVKNNNSRKREIIRGIFRVQTFANKKYIIVSNM